MVPVVECALEVTAPVGENGPRVTYTVSEGDPCVMCKLLRL